jgi:hypothetical protein
MKRQKEATKMTMDYLGLVQKSIEMENRFVEWKKNNPEDNQQMEALVEMQRRLMNIAHTCVIAANNGAAE